jgi:branched-chain amino acid transport system substrate-binding protein
MQKLKKSIVVTGLAAFAVMATATIPFANAAAKKAAGKPILVGFINQDSPGAVPTYKGTAESLLAEKWINANGGIKGRPIKVVTCSTKGTPESSQQCANKMISQKVKFVSKNIDNGWDGALNALKQSNIAVLGGLPTQPNEFGAPNAFYLTGGSPTIITGMSLYALQYEKPKTVTVITSTNPAAKAALALAVGPLQAAGLKPAVIEVADDAPDFNPAVKSAVENTPDLLISLLSPPQCLGVMQAMKSQGIKTRMVTTGLCNNAEIFKAAGDAADNWVYGAGGDDINVTPDKQQFVDYRDAIAKFSKGKLVVDADAVYGFTNMVEVASVLDKLAVKDLDAKNDVALAALRTYMTSPGATSRYATTPYTCGKSKLFPSVCGFTVSQFLRVNGKLTDATGGKGVNSFIG